MKKNTKHVFVNNETLCKHMPLFAVVLGTGIIDKFVKSFVTYMSSRRTSKASCFVDIHVINKVLTISTY